MASALETAAAGMVAGDWLAFTSTNISVLQQGPTAGNQLPFASQGAWDPVRRKLHYLGNDHNPGDSFINYFIYDEDTNTWSEIPQSVVPNNHGYDMTAIDPASGTVYRNKGGDNFSYEKAFNTDTFSVISPAATGFGAQVNNGSCWWTGSLTGAGPNGAWLLYFQSDNGHVSLYDPVADSWIADGATITIGNGHNTYHGAAKYSATYNVAIVGGGNEDPTKVWRMNSDWSITALTDSPINWGNGPFSNVTADPTSGKFLFLGYGVLLELNPTGFGTWTQITGTSIPSQVANPQENGGSSKMISWAIPAYGVVVYTWANGGSSAGMYLYKHAASVPVSPQLGLFLRA